MAADTSGGAGQSKCDTCTSLAEVCVLLTAHQERLETTLRRIIQHGEGSPNANLEAMLVAQALIDNQHPDHLSAIAQATEWVQADLNLPHPDVPYSGELRVGTPTGPD